MTQADFYVLAGQTQLDRLRFVCRLAEKAQASQSSVRIQVDSAQVAKELDDLLWVYPPTGFVPHSVQGQSTPPTPVSIHWNNDPSHHEIMIHLSAEIPPFFSHFQRYISVVVQEDRVLSDTRKHYKFLKDRGYQVKMHDMRLP